MFNSTPIWVLFINATGAMMIPTAAPAYYSCQTSAPGWYGGPMPTTLGSRSNGTACYNNGAGNTGDYTNQIQVLHCGGYYLYALIAPSQCSLRYCTT